MSRKQNMRSVNAKISRKNFIKVASRPNGINHQDYHLFCVINSFAEKGKLFFQSHKEIEEMSGISQRSIKRSFKRLSDKGWITRLKKRGRRTTWTINRNAEWVKEAADNTQFSTFIMVYREFKELGIRSLPYFIFCQILENHRNNRKFALSTIKLAQYHNTSTESIKRAFNELRKQNLIIGKAPHWEINLKNIHVLKFLVQNGIKKEEDGLHIFQYYPTA